MGQDGEVYYLAYWYPQMAVYDDVNGWTAELYQGDGEFYMGYGSYDVSITVPEGWLVRATGTLQNPDEVLSATTRERLAQAARSDTVVTVVGADERGAGSATATSEAGTLTWRFRAENVRDVAFGTSDAYVWDATTAQTGDADDGTGLGVRVVRMLDLGEDRFWHLGAAVSVEEPDHQDARPVRFRTRPESRPSELRFVDTGALGEVDTIRQIGLELAGVHGSWWWQGELMRADVATAVGPDHALDGGYLSAGWILTGESRPHNGSVFKGVKPAGSAGAWELVARASRVDLDDGALAGGRQTNLTLGVNWYLRSNLRFMANLIRVDSTRAGVDDDPRILLLRGQFHF